MLKGIFSFALVLFSLASLAQNTFDSVIVSATRLPVKLYESGKNITVISRDEIKQLPVSTVDELLYYVGGVNINSRGPFGVQADIGMRGSTYSQVLVLVDNQRLNDPLTGHYNNNIPIPMSEIHHIEIVRGSATASFGSDAVGGIIHIKTKAFVALNSNVNSASSTGNIGFGEYGLTSTDLQIGRQYNKLGFTASMRSAGSDGEQHLNPNFINSQKGDSLYNNFFDLKTYTAALTYKHKNWQAYARGGRDNRSFAAKYFYTASEWDESTEETSAYWTQGMLAYDDGNQRTEFTLSYKKSTDEFIFNPLFPTNNHTMQRINATLMQQRKVKGIHLNYGVQTDNRDIESNDRGEHSRLSNALFILGNKKIDALNLSGGLRLEQSEQIGVQLVPQVNAAFQKGNTVLRSSIGRAIRQGDFTEQFNNNNTPQVLPGRSVGNPDLEAESSWNFDIGVDQYWNHFKISNTVFARQSSNLIDFVQTNSLDITNLTNLLDTTDYFYAQNLAETFTFGNELSLKYKKQFAFSTLLARVNYTYIQTNSELATISKYIANHPIHNLNALVNYTYKGLGINLGGSLITREGSEIATVDGEVPENYFLLNSRLSYTTDLLPLSVYVDIRNVLDTEYQEILGARMPGRWILGGIKWDIHNFKIAYPPIR